MNLKLLNRGYFEQAGDNGAAGGGGGEGGEGGTPTIEELQTTVATLQSSVEKLEAKNAELLGETKAAKEARRKAEEQAKREADEKARAEGNYEQLHKSALAELEKERNEHQTFRETIANKDRKIAATGIAITLADGENAELLSEFIVKRLKSVDGEIKVTDEKGNLTVSTLDELKKEFQNNPRFGALLKGNQSSGGGAAGGDTGGGAAKTVTRNEFDSMTPIARAKFTKDGGRVID